MPANHSHTIQKQIFELSASGRGINANWEQRAADCVRNILNPCIEECFNEASGNNQHLIIDKLDIDLGNFTSEEFEKIIAQKLREVLSVQLQQCVVASSQQKNNNSPGESGNSVQRKSSDGFVSESDLPLMNENDNESTVENPARLFTNSQAVQIALIHFLMEGRFPWWYSIESNSILVDEIYETNWMREISEQEKISLKHTLQNAEAARIRISNHFTAEWISELLEKINLRGDEALTEWKLFAQLAEKFSNLKKILHQNFWVEWIELIEATSKATAFDKAIVSILHKTARGNDSVFTALVNEIKNIAPEKVIILNESSEVTIASEHSSLTITPDKKIIDKILDEISAEKETISGLTKKPSTPEIEEGLMISAAGMVILHPFLEELFSSNNLLSKKTWASEAAQSRAVKFLAYLSYANENAPEYDLVFHKTLVGMDVETAIAADEPLTPEEINSCNELLQAVIAHWKALRNTSIDGLREAFLQREGKISLADRGYIVHVAQKPQDVLLSHLPWGCGMIKLPWLSNIIHVTWI